MEEKLEPQLFGWEKKKKKKENEREIISGSHTNFVLSIYREKIEEKRGENRIIIIILSILQ